MSGISFDNFSIESLIWDPKSYTLTLIRLLECDNNYEKLYIGNNQIVESLEVIYKERV